MALAPGIRLGPYEVTAQIGVGGMGVYIVKPESDATATNRLVVVQNWFRELNRLVPVN